LQADIDQGKDVQESYEQVYNRALEVFNLSNPVRENRALACVYMPEDIIEGMKTEVRYQPISPEECTFDSDFAVSAAPDRQELP
jgi:hypothetical protein